MTIKLTSKEIVDELSNVVDPSLAQKVMESYEEIQQRFLAGDWQPAELNGGRLCEAVSRCLYQMDAGKVAHSKGVGEIRKYLLDNNLPHAMAGRDRYHIVKVMEVVYKFRNERGAVHISPDYDANYMDSMLVLHAAKWVLAEFLRLAWQKDERVIASTIAQLVQLEHSVIHELDGQPLVLARGISATHEVLLLLNHAPAHRLSRLELQRQATNQKPQNVAVAVARLIERKDIRPIGEEVALTPNGQERVMKEILPKLTKTRAVRRAAA